jgi:hypothetical protein
MSLLQHDAVTLDLPYTESSSRESTLRRQLFEQSAQFAERERILLEERDRLMKTITELHHRLRRAEMIGVHAVGA